MTVPKCFVFPLILAQAEVRAGWTVACIFWLAGRQMTPRRTDGNSNKGDITMSTITTKDGAEIYYKDWGTGQPVVFSHGWPLSSEAWAGQMLFLAQNGYRAIAHDRRGHGRSSQASSHNDMNSYADD